ncbi:EamA family transporter [Candidatus Solincola tengchongensis]|uniref:EamA family transporter n=1 Tax=Candidatus Solincola tengchongensis TaxID=2900693 RepID=UPI00257EAC11|nr:EamA family transporter [Candidatus Solincola tengchongensis]
MEAAVKPMSYLVILISVALAISGQICLRRGMAEVKERTGMNAGQLMRKPATFIREIATTWMVILGLVLFVASALFWLIVLTDVPLGVAYPFVSLTYIVVMLYDRFFEGREIIALNWLGVAAIVLGIILINWGQWSQTSP